MLESNVIENKKPKLSVQIKCEEDSYPDSSQVLPPISMTSEFDLPESKLEPDLLPSKIETQGEESPGTSTLGAIVKTETSQSPESFLPSSTGSSKPRVVYSLLCALEGFGVCPFCQYELCSDMKYLAEHVYSNHPLEAQKIHDELVEFNRFLFNSCHDPASDKLNCPCCAPQKRFSRIDLLRKHLRVHDSFLSETLSDHKLSHLLGLRLVQSNEKRPSAASARVKEEKKKTAEKRKIVQIDMPPVPKQEPNDVVCECGFAAKTANQLQCHRTLAHSNKKFSMAESLKVNSLYSCVQWTMSMNLSNCPFCSDALSSNAEHTVAHIMEKHPREANRIHEELSTLLKSLFEMYTPVSKNYHCGFGCTERFAQVQWFRRHIEEQHETRFNLMLVEANLHHLLRMKFGDVTTYPLPVGQEAKEYPVHKKPSDVKSLTVDTAIPIEQDFVCLSEVELVELKGCPICGYCDETFGYMEHMLLNHINTSAVLFNFYIQSRNGEFFCPYCAAKSAKMELVSEHIHMHHPGKVAVVQGETNQLNQNMDKQHMKYGEYVCIFGCRGKEHPRDLEGHKLHLQVMHKPQFIDMLHDLKLRELLTLKTRHLNLSKGGIPLLKTYSCLLCSTICLSEQQWMDHAFQSHGNGIAIEKPMDGHGLK